MGIGRAGGWWACGGQSAADEASDAAAADCAAGSSTAERSRGSPRSEDTITLQAEEPCSQACRQADSLRRLQQASKQQLAPARAHALRWCDATCVHSFLCFGPLPMHAIGTAIPVPAGTRMEHLHAHICMHTCTASPHMRPHRSGTCGKRTGRPPGRDRGCMGGRCTRTPAPLLLLLLLPPAPPAPATPAAAPLLGGAGSVCVGHASVLQRSPSVTSTCAPAVAAGMLHMTAKSSQGAPAPGGGMAAEPPVGWWPCRRCTARRPASLQRPSRSTPTAAHWLRACCRRPALSNNAMRAIGGAVLRPRCAVRAWGQPQLSRPRCCHGPVGCYITNMVAWGARRQHA